MKPSPTLRPGSPLLHTSAKSGLRSALFASRNGTKFFEPISSSPSMTMVTSTGSDPVTGGRLAIAGKGRIGRDRFDPQQRKQPLEAVVEIGVDAVEDRLKLWVGHHDIP